MFLYICILLIHIFFIFSKCVSSTFNWKVFMFGCFTNMFYYTYTCILFTLAILLSKVFTWKASKCWLFSLFKFTYVLILYFCRGSTSSASSCKRTGRPTVHCWRNRWTPRGNGCVNCHCIVVADSIFPVDALTTS